MLTNNYDTGDEHQNVPQIEQVLCDNLPQTKKKYAMGLSGNLPAQRRLLAQDMGNTWGKHCKTLTSIFVFLLKSQMFTPRDSCTGITWSKHL